MKVAFVIVLSLLAVAAAGLAFWLWTPDRPRAELERKYLRAAADMVDVAGLLLHVRDDGPRDKPAVIMIHGFGSSLHTWEGWAQGLKDDLRVLRLDLPGAGLSSLDPTGEYTDARAIAVIAALMDELGLERASLIGNSIGGRIAWRFAAEKPERVDKLVLVSPDGFASKGFAYGQKPNVPAMAKLMKYALPKSFLRMNLEPAYGDKAALSDATVDRYHDLMLTPGIRGAIIERMAQTMLQDPAPSLRAIAAPVLLVWGEKDGAIPLSNSADYLRLLRNAKLESFPALGHVPQEEAPAITLPAVKSFLLQ